MQVTELFPTEGRKAPSPKGGVEEGSTDPKERATPKGGRFFLEV